MRKFILITAFVLASATAQAWTTRGLVLASNDEPAAVASDATQTSVIPKTSPKAVEPSKAAEEPKAVEAPKAVETPKAAEAPTPVEAPKFVERPAAVDTTAEAPKADEARPAREKNTQALRGEKPKRKYVSTEARVIYELHRHGIYW